mmetsp:Transcript_22638/g.59839  ORF Transcript_22638/g.59839 Transcript_22638/m.59839 type:complete len:272 (+) Transcript_22638:2342-3157(+)
MPRLRKLQTSRFPRQSLPRSSSCSCSRTCSVSSFRSRWRTTLAGRKDISVTPASRPTAKLIRRPVAAAATNQSADAQSSGLPDSWPSARCRRPSTAGSSLQCTLHARSSIGTQKSALRRAQRRNSPKASLRRGPFCQKRDAHTPPPSELRDVHHLVALATRVLTTMARSWSSVKGSVSQRCSWSSLRSNSCAVYSTCADRWLKPLRTMRGSTLSNLGTRLASTSAPMCSGEWERARMWRFRAPMSCFRRSRCFWMRDFIRPARRSNASPGG